MRKGLKIITWVLMIVALVFFWLSLRSTEGNFEYTPLCARFYRCGRGSTNYFLRKYEKEEKEN